MALKRADVRAIFAGVEGITDEHIDRVMDALHEEIDPLKDELADAKKTSGSDAQRWKDKYESEHREYEAFKADQAKKDTAAKKSEALKALLKDEGKLSENGLEKVLKYHNLDSIELDDDGKIKDAKKLVKEIQTEWSDYVTVEGTEGANTNGKDGAGHGGGNGGSGTFKTREEIESISDPIARQRAIAENHELFGF